MQASDPLDSRAVLGAVGAAWQRRSWWPDRHLLRFYALRSVGVA
jgi:hypothetical protein